jgi:hypothetical protein
MAMRSRRITFKAHSWVYESKQICWDLQQLNYDVKLIRIPSHVGVSGNVVADGLDRQAEESGTVHERMTVAKDTGYWLDKHGWRTGDTGRFAPSIQAVVSVKPWFDRQLEEMSFVTTISRVMCGHCSVRAHLERFRIVGDPICVCNKTFFSRYLRHQL